VAARDLAPPGDTFGWRLSPLGMAQERFWGNGATDGRGRRANELDITKDGIDRHEANNNDTPLASTRSRDIAVFLDVVRAAHYIPRIGFGLAQMSLGLRDQR
jgi:hypothetical protein